MRKIYSAFLLSFALLSFSNAKAQSTIHVVFHVVYNTTGQNIPDSCLQDQLDVLNEDFNAANADLWKVPAAWTPIIGNMNVNFVLATQDPNGNPTTGIERRQYPTTSWSTNDNVKHYASGGLDAWPDTAYLNIWVCNLANGLNGYTQLPGGASATDGVVLHYRVVGRGSYAMAPFNLGRTGTHEVGHWFGLLHFGPNSNCSLDTDDIPDTPTFSDNMIYGGYNPFQVVTDACNPSTPGIMWMNFLTYVNDSSMYFFTQNQVDTMIWVMNNLRQGMGNPLGNQAVQQNHSAVSVFPSPSADGLFTIQRSNTEEVTVLVYNSLGEAVAAQQTIAENQNRFTLDLSTLPSGLYSVVLLGKEKQETKLVSIVK